MKKLDFLPNKYHERHAAEDLSFSRWLVAGSLLLGMVPIAGYQYFDHLRASHNAAELAPSYLHAQQQLARLDQLGEQVALAQGEAALLAYLNHPWPRTKILAHVHEPLPESIRLTSLKLAHEPKKGDTQNDATRARGSLRSSGRSDATATTVDNSPPAIRDLKKLAEHHERHDQTVTLVGFTANTTDLHAYVARLRLPGLFVKSELKSLESLPGQENSRSQKFEIRLVLAPGYGKLPSNKAAGADAVARRAPAAHSLALRP